MAVNKIQKFIKANELSFDGTGSDLNGNCVVLAGYALHLKLGFYEMHKMMGGIEVSDTEELQRVYDYVDAHNYGDFWGTPEAKEKYKF